MTPFIITKDGDIYNFAGGKVDAIYQTDDQYFDFFEEQIKELQVGKSQSIIASVFQTIMGTRPKTRRRQVMGIPSTLVMVG